MTTPSWYYENMYSQYKFIAGIDEAGRGSLAGPVVAAAVILPKVNLSVNDSKKLSAAKRISLFDEIKSLAVGIGIGIVESDEIDRINILNASIAAMESAVKNLNPAPDFLLTDALKLNLNIAQAAIIKGDTKSISIASASIIAKVTRDNIMKEYDKLYPGYGFGKHKGYGTKAHKEALAELGICLIHRKSFKLGG